MISDPGLTLTLYAAEPGQPTANALDLLDRPADIHPSRHLTQLTIDGQAVHRARLLTVGNGIVVNVPVNGMIQAR